MAAILSLELIESVAGSISVGASVTDTAGALGIGRSTLYRWLKEGKEAAGRQAAGYDDFEPLLLRLHEEVEKATHEAKVEALMAIRKGFRGWTETETTTVTGEDGKVKTTVKTRTRFDWQAALAYLERKHPKEWARLIRTAATDANGDDLPLEQQATRVADEAAAFLASLEQQPDS